MERGQCGRWGGEGGKGGEGAAATEHYSSLSFREEIIVVGGKENMWAVRAGSAGSGEGTAVGGGGCAGGRVCGGCGWWVVGAVKAQCERWGR